MKGRIADFLFISTSRGRLTIDIEADFRETFDKLKDQPVEVSVKKYHEPRTLKANAYMWALVNEIGNRLRYSKEEIYFDMLRQYGQSGVASIQPKDEDKFTRAWKYHELLGESENNGKTFKHYRFWVGSSEYNREEFSILLDGIVAEAKSLGIETRPADEVEAMLKEWDHE